jgi:hypothetical protein
MKVISKNHNTEVTSGEVANPQVRPIYHLPTRLFCIFILVVEEVVCPLGGGVGGVGVPTVYLKDDDGGTPGRQCRRSGSVHHLS